MGRKKQKKKEELLAPDPFMEKATKAAGWVQKHLYPIVGICVLVLGSVYAVEYVRNQSQRGASLMTTHLGEALKSYDEATEPGKTITSTDTAALEADLEKARKKIEDFREENKKENAALVALLYEADLSRRLGKHEEALELYREYSKKVPPLDNMRFIALEGAGYALEAQGKLDEAVEQYSLLAQSDSFYKDYGLKHKARVLEQKGNKDEAVAAYQEIVDMDPESKLKSFAEDRLKVLQ